jgi:hypothetical protein
MRPHRQSDEARGDGCGKTGTVKIVAHSVSKRTRLSKREVMWNRRYAVAHNTRLPQDELQVVLIAQADRFAPQRGVSEGPVSVTVGKRSDCCNKRLIWVGREFQLSRHHWVGARPETVASSRCRVPRRDVCHI